MASSGMTRRRYFVRGSVSVGIRGEPLSMTPSPPSNSRITDFGLILRISATSERCAEFGKCAWLKVYRRRFYKRRRAVSSSCLFLQCRKFVQGINPPGIAWDFSQNSI